MKLLLGIFLALSSSMFCVYAEHAGIDSGGGITSVGNLVNASSIGSPFQSSPKPIGTSTNQTGLIAILYGAVTASGSSDSDGDGLPDAWKIKYGLTIGVDESGSDYDGDGATAWEEYIAGTDPTDADSVARANFTKSGDLHKISIQTAKGRNYTLLVSDDLKAWHAYDSAAGNGSIHEFDFNPHSKKTQSIFGEDVEPNPCFFKLKIDLAE